MGNYNNNRPHLALGNLTSNEFIKKFMEKEAKEELALLKMWCGIRINVRYYHCVILTQIAHL